MKKHLFTRLMSLLLVLALCAGFVVPVSARGSQESNALSFHQVDNSAVNADWLDGEVVHEEETSPYADTQMVRVSVLLDGESAVAAGFALENIGQNEDAAAYRKALRQTQSTVQSAIEQQVLGGQQLEVAWNLTLATNLISCNVPYGTIDEIRALDGVASVILETRYEPAVVERSEVSNPNMATSPIMIGTSTAYASGYTGAGSRIAIIDTGTDTDHQSFSPEGFRYSLSRLAEAAETTTEEYVAGLGLLDADEIADVLDQLHVTERRQLTADALYVNEKLPFGFNYIDNDLDLTHDNDSMSEHGSHVAGIAAANAYIPDGNGGFALALDEVHVQGVAPDAQIITMKVFGKNGGAYSSDYMAAMEDAIVLGCDAINLSLGSSQPGFAAMDDAYTHMVQGLMDSGAVISISAGNANSWADYAYTGGYLYGDDVNLHTGGSPGTWPISFAVASAENVGYTRNYFTVADRNIFYTEPQYMNKPLALALSGEIEYVYMETTESTFGMDELQDILKGRILVVPRGGGQAFWEKASGAVFNGAIGTIIYNNQPGIFYMNLAMYPFYEPCVAIAQEDAVVLKENGEEFTHETGVVYSIGKLKVEGLADSVYYEDQSRYMSDYSSWGVPGDLTMKPEITAPGGDIYSVYGSTPDGGGSDQYESMSGTSMAAPQIAGMAALMAQYIEATGLDEKTGLSARKLTHSLLMSTAEPMLESDNNNQYYSILDQGAGLANVGAAVSADSYILMNNDANATAEDGKVKVELGHDPERSGKYTFGFTLHNLADQEQTFELSASFFTQALFEGIFGEGEAQTTEIMLDKYTTPLNVTTAWTVDGEALTPGDSVQGMDFDGDGDVDELDGQALLEYATGLRSELSNPELADLDSDGDLDSHDAYLFFRDYCAGTLILPASGQADVTVTVELTQAQKEILNEQYVNGAYLEGFVFVQELTSEDGALGTSHSIPVLGFYGDWSDPSMFETGSYSTYRTGDETRIPYSGDVQTNNISITYADTPGRLYYYGGNFVVADETYHPERNAINGEVGDMIGRAFFAPIRNVAASRFTITNEETGEILYDIFPGGTAGAFYSTSAGVWANTNQSIKLNWKPEGLEEGETFRMTLTLVPETHVDANGNVDWDALGRGTRISMPMTIDNTAPVLEEVALSLTGNELIVKASDNQYIAGAVLFDGSGNYLLRRTGAHEDIQPGETGEYRLSLSEINGTRFMLQVVDYAYNITTYMIQQDIGEAAELPQFVAFNYGDFSWVGFNEATLGEHTFWKSTETRIYAATMVDNMIYASDINGDLTVINAEANYEEYDLRNTGWYPGDMAYNPVDGYIYAVLNINKYKLKDPIIYSLLRIDKMTGEVTVAGTLPVLTNTLACDGNGTFYCNKYETGEIYAFTLDDLTQAELICTIADAAYPLSLQAMEWDYNTDTLRWAAYHEVNWKSQSGLVTINVRDGSYTYADTNRESYNGLVIPVKDAKTGSWADKTDKVSLIALSETEKTMLMNSELRLVADVLPWTVSDRAVTFSSTDPAVASVDAYGKITAIAPGEADIIVSSVIDPDASATCHITVEKLQVTFTGITRDETDATRFFTWDIANDTACELGIALDTSIIAAAEIPGSQKVYAVDDRNGAWGIHQIDMTTGETIAQSGSERFRLPLQDLAFNSYYTSLDGIDQVAAVYEGYVFPKLDPLAPSETLIYDMTEKLVTREATHLLAIASAGYELYTSYGKSYDSEHLYVLDNRGNIWELYFYQSGGTMRAYYGYRPTDLLSAGLELSSDDPSAYSYTSMIVGEDGALYVSAYNGLNCDLFRLDYNATAKTFSASRVGAMADGPVALLTADSNQQSETPDTTDLQPLDASCITTVEEILAAQHKVSTGNLSSIVDEQPVEDENTVTLTVTAKDIYGNDVTATNGVVTMTYDPTVLTLKSVQVGGDYRAIDQDTEGEVTFGYVSLAGIQASDAVATFTFVRSQCDAGTTQLTLTHREVNAVHPDYIETLELHYEHNATEIRGAKEATCTEDGYTGDVYCVVCDELLTEGEVIPAYCPTAGYTDVPVDAWYHEAVDYVVANGIMEGIADGIFQPNGTTTRAQLVTVLYRLAGSPETELTEQFTDVNAEAWYAEAVAWAYANEITTGITDTLFAPEQPVTREQVVTFLYRYAQFAGVDTTNDGDLSTFTDADAVSEYALEAMTWAVDAGIITGMDEATLAPSGTCIRAQIATVLMRFMEMNQ